MGAYALPDDVRLAANPEWRPGSPEPDAGAQDASSLTDAQLTDAISQASARIDSYIGARYQTPVDADGLVAEPQIAFWARDIGLYLATLTYLRGMTLEPTHPVALRFAQALADLVAARDGKAALNLPAATTGDREDTSGGFAGVVDGGLGGIFDAGDAGYHRDSRFIGSELVTGQASWVGYGN